MIGIKKVKRLLFSKLVVEIENKASSKKMWGNNIQTSLCLSKVICSHLTLLDGSKFKDDNDSTTIVSSFANNEEIFSWLSGVKNVYRYFDETNSRAYPEEYKGLVVTQAADVHLLTLITNRGGVYDLRAFIERLDKELSQLHKLESELPHVVRNSLKLKFSNGFNTILLIEELIVEAMING